jgi:hypothetical protein
VVVLRVHGGRVVLVVVEVPARDVVGVAVAVVVDAVGETDDDVLGIDQAVAVGIGRVGVVASVKDAVALARRRLRELARVDVGLVRELFRSRQLTPPSM